MEPYVPIPGKPPRKVVIDRQKKLFARLDIRDLLSDLVPQIGEPTKVEWLPLELFDDTEFDCRTPDEWISLGYRDEGKFEPIGGTGLWKDAEGVGHWRKCLVYKYDPKREVYEGVWDDGTTEKAELTRINLLFSAEDPRIFAQRVAKAHKDRIYADSQIRYNFFIDNMPKTDLPELDTEQTGRIKEKAKAAKCLKDAQVDINSITQEVNKDYQRTMNKIIFDKAMEEKETRELIDIDLTMPPTEENTEVAYYGMVPIPPHEFPENFS